MVFVAIAIWVEVDDSIPGDERALVELNDAIGTDADDVMTTIGDLTDPLPLAVLCALALGGLWVARRLGDARLFLIAVVVAAVGNRVLKELVARARPDVRPSPESVSEFSFPSGHAANTAAVLGALLLVTRTPSARRAVLAIGGAVVVAVGFSRLAIGVHYPSDVVAAWLWVAAWVTLLWSFRTAGSAAAS